MLYLIFYHLFLLKKFFRQARLSGHPISCSLCRRKFETLQQLNDHYLEHIFNVQNVNPDHSQFSGESSDQSLGSLSPGYPSSPSQTFKY